MSDLVELGTMAALIAFVLIGGLIIGSIVVDQVAALVAR